MSVGNRIIRKSWLLESMEHMTQSALFVLLSYGLLLCVLYIQKSDWDMIRCNQ